MKLLTISLSVLSIAHGIITIGMESNKHPQDQVTVPASLKKSKSTQPIACVRCPIPVCNRIFKNYGGLDIHTPIHDMSRPYKCTICREGFVSEKGLAIHKGTKTHKHNEANAQKNPIASAAAELLLELSVKKS